MKEGVIAALRAQVAGESYARKLGLNLVEVSPGHAVVEMAPAEDMRNIFGMTHGGAIFSLIDEAFQASCNSHGRMAVALNVTITYHHPPDRESILRAESQEIHRTKKTGTYEIKVTDGEGVLIATCLALAYRKRSRLPFLEKSE